MKQIRMTTAVLLAIKSFTSEVFSIYDLTTKIRDDVNNRDYRIILFGDKVEHGTVKEHFNELIEVGLLDELYVYHNSSGYREFCSVDPTTQVSPPPTVDVKKAVTTTPIPIDVQLKIYSYLKNNGNVTMKMIQSRLKGYPYTCEEIAKFLNDINLIDDSTQLLPPSRQVAVKIN